MEAEDAFWYLHGGLPRQAPGSDATTTALLDAALDRRELHTAIDIGCGQGRSTLLLARRGLNVTAVDISARLLEVLVESARTEGLLGSVTVEACPMDQIAHAPGSFDLLWAESCIYVIGWQRALELWRPLLASGGRAVVTELCWLTDEPSSTAAEFWGAGYPTMTTIDGSIALARDEGFDTIHTTILPDQDWWDEYYGPLAERIARIDESDDPMLHTIATMISSEIDIRREYAAEFGYVGFVLEPR